MKELSAPLLSSCAKVVNELLRLAEPADAVLGRWFRQHRSGSNDRRLIAETAYTVLRRYRWLTRLANAVEANIEKAAEITGENKVAEVVEQKAIVTTSISQANSELISKKLILTALIKLQGISIRQLASVCSASEMRWLEKLKAQPEPKASELSLAEQADLPDWLVEKLSPPMSAEDLLALARALNQPAGLDLRVNSMQAKRDDVLQRMQNDGYAVKAGAYSPFALRLEGRPPIATYPLFLKGTIEVQDEGSQLVGLLLAPKRGEMVADFCAGAGGKTLLLGDLMRSSGRLYAFDTSAQRLARLKPRLARSGLSNVHPIVIANERDAHLKRLAGKFDRVLVDAPCSGLGTLRRNPDIKWRQTAHDVEELVAKQGRILAAAANLLKPGGRLVYATCSILPEENVEVVNAFLAQTPQFKRLDVAAELARLQIPLATGDDLVLSPLLHGTDGFYAAILERSK